MSRHRHSKSKPKQPDAGDRTGDRLQKVLAAAGMGSRRECEELIVTGRVEIDGETVTKLGTRVNPLTQEVRVDGVALPRPKRLHFMLNKPPGVVCTNKDPSGRTRAVDLIRSGERLFTVGRLDRSSEGMILITNDGELANQLTHPRYGVEKRYLVRIVGSPNPVIFEKLRKGIHLAEGVARVSDLRVRKRTSKFTDLEIVLQEGRNREIRRILARIGHKVVRLKRIAIGPLRLGELGVGDSRPLTRDEVRLLQQATQKSGRRSRRPPGAKRPAGLGPTKKHPSDPRPKQAPVEGKKPISRPAPLPLELDEVEVTERPWETQRGAVIGGEESWDRGEEGQAGPKRRPPKKHRRSQS